MVILITGASSGFGKLTAERLIEKAHVVYAAARRIDKMEDLRLKGCHLLKMDVTDDESVQAAVHKIVEEQGRVDVLLNNAGYGSLNTVEDISMDELKYQFDVNVFGYARLQKAVLPYMRKQKSGKIILVSSVVGRVSTPFMAWYSATKHAVEAMADGLRMELIDCGVDVVKIRPGAVKTGFDQIAVDKLKNANIADDYKPLLKIFLNAITKMYENCEGPERTVKNIVTAIESRSPKKYYNTTPDAKLMIFLKRMLGEKLFDKALIAKFK